MTGCVRRFKQRAAAENEESPASPALVTFVMLMATAAHRQAARHGHHAERDGDGKDSPGQWARRRESPPRKNSGRARWLLYLLQEHLEMGRGRVI